MSLSLSPDPLSKTLYCHLQVEVARLLTGILAGNFKFLRTLVGGLELNVFFNFCCIDLAIHLFDMFSTCSLMLEFISFLIIIIIFFISLLPWAGHIQ